MEIQKLIPQINRILQIHPHNQGAQFYIRLTHQWVIKQPKLNPPFPNGKRVKAVEPKEILNRLNKIKKMKFPKLKIPETHYNEEFDVLIQKRIYGTSLDDWGDPDLFNSIKDEFNKQKEKCGLQRGQCVLQARNVIIDKYQNLWLIDPD